MTSIFYIIAGIIINFSVFGSLFAEAGTNVADTLISDNVDIDKKFTRNLLVFTATYCSICKVEEARFETIKKVFQDNKIRLLFVYVDKLPDKQTKLDSGAKLIFDKNHDLENLLSPPSLPAAFMLDQHLNPLSQHASDGTKKILMFEADSDGLFSEKNLAKMLKEELK